MTAKKRKPPRPHKLLAALFEAQKEATKVPATTTKVSKDGPKLEETSYASSDDVIAVARCLLHAQDLMVNLTGSAIQMPERKGQRSVMRLFVTIVHMPSRQQVEREYQVEIYDRYGSNAAATSGMAMALRLILLLPREADHTSVSIDDTEEPDHVPRSSRRVIRTPEPYLASNVANRLDDAVEVEDNKEACRRMMSGLVNPEKGVTPQSLRADAGLPLANTAALTVAEWRHFRDFLEQLRGEGRPME